MFETNQVTSEIESYLLGFLYADGSIHGKVGKDYYVLSIGLKESDKEFLQSIVDIFNHGLNKKYKLKYNPKTKSYKVSICSIYLIKNLMRLGISHRKTYEKNPRVFNNIPEEFKNHFIRGLFDGDGTVCKGKDNKFRAGIISMNEPLLVNIRTYLIKKGIKVPKLILENGKYCRMNFSGNQSVKNFLSIIYDKSNICLKRKRDKFESIPEKYKKYNYKGISIHHKDNRWKSVIYINQGEQKRWLGLHKTEKDAVEAYNQESVQLNKPIQNWVGESNVKFAR